MKNEKILGMLNENKIEELTKLDVKPNPTNVPTGEPVMTKEKFDAMTMVQQKAWKDANIDKYREWYPQK